MRAWWSVLVAIVGCGDNRPLAVDAGVIDGPDGLVTFTYYAGDFTSSRGLSVWFQNPDSSLILATRTIDDGTANAFMPNGGFVTMQDANGELWTWGGVKPGDDIVLGERPRTPGGFDINVRVPVDPAANTYWLHTSCGDSAEITGAQLELRVFNVSDCGADAMDLLLVTRELNFSSIASFAIRRDLDLNLSRTFVFEGPLSPVPPSTIQLRSVPSRFGYFYARQELRARDGGLLFDTGSFGTGLIQNVQGSGATTLEVPLPAEVTLVTYVDDVNTNLQSSLLHMIEWAPARQVTEIRVDERGVRSFVGQPTFERTASTLRWGETSDGMLAEAALADLVFGDLGRLRWHVIAPRSKPELLGEGSIRLPVLPDPTLVPTADESVRAIQLRSIIATGGYDAYRTQLLGRAPNAAWPIVGSDGRVSWSELSQDRP